MSTGTGVLALAAEVRIPFRLTEVDIEATVVLLRDTALVRLTLETPPGQLLKEAELAALGAYVGTWHVPLTADGDAVRNETDRLRTEAAGDLARLVDLDGLEAHSPKCGLLIHAWRPAHPAEPGTGYGLADRRLPQRVRRARRRPGRGGGGGDVSGRRPYANAPRRGTAGRLPRRLRGGQAGVWRIRVMATGHTHGRRPFTREQCFTAVAPAGGDGPPVHVVVSDEDGEPAQC
ncbi:hypothetical protein [Streptomyces sp. yr375]|uniref:hypothetical protein n=1 Tax=Streptomyces sp. yr375 TaxID=1761906 RepID=UPI000B86FCF7|nr:hypothetical protein [Streptomyces sp. yr375]